MNGEYYRELNAPFVDYLSKKPQSSKLAERDPVQVAVLERKVRALFNTRSGPLSDLQQHVVEIQYRIDNKMGYLDEEGWSEYEGPLIHHSIYSVPVSLNDPDMTLYDCYIDEKVVNGALGYMQNEEELYATIKMVSCNGAAQLPLVTTQTGEDAGREDVAEDVTAHFGECELMIDEKEKTIAYTVGVVHEREGVAMDNTIGLVVVNKGGSTEAIPCSLGKIKTNETAVGICRTEDAGVEFGATATIGMIVMGRNDSLTRFAYVYCNKNILTETQPDDDPKLTKIYDDYKESWMAAFVTGVVSLMLAILLAYFTWRMWKLVRGKKIRWKKKEPDVEDDDGEIEVFQYEDDGT